MNSGKKVESKAGNLKSVVDRLPDLEAVLSPEAINPAGRWEEVEMPDTLDLADRAALSVNGMIGNMKPDQHYAGTQCFRFGILEPYDDHPNWAMPMKFLRALPLNRAMCGSDEYADVEVAAARAVLQQVAEDGQLYYPISKDGPPAGTCYPSHAGFFVMALLQRHASDDNPVWLEWAKVLCDGLKQSAIQVGDCAYYPPEWSLDAQGKWHYTLRGTPTLAGEPQEPLFEQDGGLEGTNKWEAACVIQTMVRWHVRSGDKAALDHARKLVKFSLQPKLWEDEHDLSEQAAEYSRKLLKRCLQPGYPWEKDDVLAPGHEHGISAGHGRAHTDILQAYLLFGGVIGDEHLKQIAREGYEHGRRHGVIRLGFVASWLKPTRYGRSVDLSERNEGCGVANMLILAVMLSDAGLGDYWDDVDSIIRNHLIELQIVDFDLIKKVTGAGSEYDETLRRVVGGFGSDRLTACRQSETNACCVAHGARSLYYAWEGITRFDQGVATVNLFLNRVSPWLNVLSYLPYEGKVVLQNKQAHTLQVRLPYWVDRAGLSCFVNDKPVTPPHAGSWLVLQNLKGRETVTLEFPVAETTEIYTICGTPYTAQFRGSTVVDISPRETDVEEFKNIYPFFMRDHLKATIAPMRKAGRFVADKLPQTL